MSRARFDWATPFVEADLLSSAEVHAVGLLAPRYDERDRDVLLGLAFAARAPRVGHAGVDLGTLAARVDSDRVSYARTSLDADGDGSEEARDRALAARLAKLPWPDATTWQARAIASAMVGGPDDREAPFVAQPLGASTLLLTRRLYREQVLVAQALRRRVAAPVAAPRRIDDLDARLATLCGAEAASSESANAVRLASTERLALVIGGPGTGKTFSITRLLAALFASHRSERPLVVKLAAPTGKAAVRMREAIREATEPAARAPLPIDDALRERLRALEASTLHRLLAIRPDGSARHDRRNPVAADVVVVDEVSMVDLATMRRLVEAIADDARLVLIGDRDQLASVEAGCVLADLVGEGTSGPLERHVQRFTHSHRFAAAPDVALVAACLQSYATRLEGVPFDEPARRALAIDVFMGRAKAKGERFEPGERVSRLEPPEAPEVGKPARPSVKALADLARPYVEGFELLADDGARRFVAGYVAELRAHLDASGRARPTLAEPRVQRALLEALDRYRVLAVHRRGPLGVSGLDRELTKLVRGALGAGARERDERHWLGQPILITENAYDVELRNGDVGLVLPTTAKTLAAVFAHEERDAVRVVALSRLPAHEGALAMTVHKSQGSQFDRVALVLAGRPSPIETRELVYTGVTRAKNQLAWLGTERELADALALRVERASGLGALLSEGAAAPREQGAR